jgi:putative DNA methylase
MFPYGKISLVARAESWRKEVNRPLYHIQKWWATRLGSVFREVLLDVLSKGEINSLPDEFYKTHDFSDKIVLDPFMGSGTTLGEALKLGARVIGNDINPVSHFLVTQELTAVSLVELDNEFSRIYSRVGQKIEGFHRDIEGNQVLYYFWIQIAQHGGRDIPLFSSYIFSKDAYPKKKPKAEILCKYCWSVFEGRYDDTLVRCPKCEREFNPQEAPVRASKVLIDGLVVPIKQLVPDNGIFEERMFAKVVMSENGKKQYKSIDDYDRKLFAEAQRLLKNTSLPIPENTIRDGYNTKQILGYNYTKWRDLFNDRQLLSLGILLEAISEISNKAVQGQFLTLFASVLEYNNRFNSYKGEGTGAVRSIFSNHILKSERFYVENSVLCDFKTSGTFGSLFNSRLKPAKRYLSEPFEVVPREFQNNYDGSKIISSKKIRPKVVSTWNDFISDGQALLFNNDSSSLQIPDESVDAVVTDPPYFDYIHYSELSDFFYVWLAQILKADYKGFTRQDSADKGEVQQKEVEAFTNLLGGVFAEANRVLKPEGNLVFSYHHSRPEGWTAIRTALLRAGFEVFDVKPILDDFGSASIKFQTKSPINIDAFIYAKKMPSVNNRNIEDPIESIQKQLEVIIDDYGKNKISLTSGDKFVIKASLLLKIYGADSSEKANYNVAKLLEQFSREG